MKGGKKEGRPKLRWLDYVANDMKSIGVKEMEEESKRHTYTGYHSEGGTG